MGWMLYVAIILSVLLFSERILLELSKKEDMTRIQFEAHKQCEQKKNVICY